jgi:prepilin-type N-terminal cleavage/methylation domain-containing protein
VIWDHGVGGGPFPSTSGSTLPEGDHQRPNQRRPDDGFTLIELIIVTAILPIVIGAIAYALVAVFSLQGSTSGRLSDSADAQVVSTNFEQDVQSAASITTNASPQNLNPPQTAPCGSTTQLLGLVWGSGALGSGTSTATEISYVAVSNGTTTSDNLVRNVCQGGNTTTPTSSTVVSYDIPLNQGPPTVAPTSTNTAALAGWTSTVGVTGVTFAIAEPGSKYAYTLVGLPRASLPSNQQTTISTPTSSCGFATAGTGTYASNLCFVDFSSWNTQSGPTCTGGGQQMNAGIAGTPYSMSFCLNVSSVDSSGNPITGAIINSSGVQIGYDDLEGVGFPTYPGSFLGNGGFYTGVPAAPALYTYQQGSTATVTITQIQVLDPSGSPATGWDLVTGDAETTDTGESDTWTTTATSGTPPVLNLLPNTPTSQIGNACINTYSSGAQYVDLTGLGTTSVECAAGVSSYKTGTVMLEAAAPTGLTVTLQGTGLQAVFIGLLLPS